MTDALFLTSDAVDDLATPADYVAAVREGERALVAPPLGLAEGTRRGAVGRPPSAAQARGDLACSLS